LIQASWNVSRMQGLGFAYAVSSLARAEGGPGHPEAPALLARHLQRFNTHPYMAAPLIGSVIRLETENRPSEAADLKNVLMGPYAAIGDSFFWSSLRPFSGIAAACLAFKGLLLAPLLFLALYSPAHLWVRARGFMTGWQQGKTGIEFIRRMDLPEKSRWTRWCSTLLLGIAAFLASSTEPSHTLFQPPVLGHIGGLLVVLASFLAVRKGLSALTILYGSVIFFAVVMMMQ
jgi:PTS system mannose-specific IID component